ncbi:MAG TPA: hypothetical protein VGQ99_05045 [Tepidisphaeraceae bacterium]|jgi:hypothetical protein|nr:hypothetical protein [Tepidisphaeraceae bacterium]
MRCVIAAAMIVGMGWASAAVADEPGMVSLSSGIIQFAPPPEPWVVSWVSPKGEAALYTMPGQGRIQMSAIPGIAPKSAQAEELTRGTLIDRLRGMRNEAKAKDKGLEIVKQLRFEIDDRFFCVMREQFRKDGNAFDQTHYYRNIQPHQFIVTVVALSEPEENVKTLREAAEKVALSARLVPRGQKAPPPPQLPADAPVPKTVDLSADAKAQAPGLAEAQKELEAATVKCEAELVKNPQYKAARAKTEAAEAKLIELRAQSPPDRAAIAQASADWLDAKRPVEVMRQAALAKDEGVIAARKRVAEERGKK